MVYESKSIMNYLGFNPSLVDGFAELCDKALTEAGLLDVERDDVRQDIEELVRTTFRDGMGYNCEFAPCDVIIDAIGQATCNELKELFPEEDFAYIADGVYSELYINGLYINGEVYDGTRHFNGYLQNYHNEQHFENFTLLSEPHLLNDSIVQFAIEISPDDLELALLRCGVNAADARNTVRRVESTHDNPHCPEMVTTIVRRTADNIIMQITDWTKCDWEGFNWRSGDYPDNTNTYSVPLTKEEKAHFEDAMQREFDKLLQEQHATSADKAEKLVER